MSDGPFRYVASKCTDIDFLEKTAKFLKMICSANYFALPYCFLETQPWIHIPYNKSVEKMAFAVDLGC